MSIKPGDPITWDHYTPDGTVTRRAGRVVDSAPRVTGTTMVWWVTPDQALAGDLYPVLAVGKANARTTAVHGRYVDSAAGMTGAQFAGKGELYASGEPSSPLGRMAVWASYAPNLNGPSPHEALSSRVGW